MYTHTSYISIETNIKSICTSETSSRSSASRIGSSSWTVLSLPRKGASNEISEAKDARTNSDESETSRCAVGTMRSITNCVLNDCETAAKCVAAAARTSGSESFSSVSNTPESATILLVYALLVLFVFSENTSTISCRRLASAQRKRHDRSDEMAVTTGRICDNYRYVYMESVEG